MSALARTLEQIRRTTAEAAADYDRLVADLADDREVPAADFMAIIEASGHTADDVQVAVERRVGRLLARQHFDAMPSAQRAKGAAEREVEQVEADRARTLADLEREHRVAVARTHAEYDQLTAPMRERVMEAEATITAGHDGAQRLRDTAPAALRDELVRYRDAHAAAVQSSERSLPGLRARLVKVDALLQGGVPAPRDEATHPLGGALERERFRRDEEQARAVREKQLANLESERTHLLRDIARLEDAPTKWAGLVAGVELQMLDV